MHAEVDFVRDALVGQVVLARDGQPEIGTGDDLVVVLNDDVVHVPPETVLFDVALEVVVGHVEFELEAALDVLHARVRAALGVDLTVEQLARLYASDHVAGAAVDAHVVTGAQFVGGRFGDVQIRILAKYVLTLKWFSPNRLLAESTYLNVGESGSRVMAQAADHLACVPVVVRMAAIWRIQAELPALVDGADVLVHAVDRLQYPSVELLELAQFRRLLDAVVLQVIVTVGLLEGRGPGNRHAIHVR